MIVFAFETSQNSVDRNMAEIYVRPMEIRDVSRCLALSYVKRRSYEKAQPLFWKYAGDIAEEKQAAWFRDLFQQADHTLLVAENNGKIVGFIIGKRCDAPEVYNPGGPTLVVDGFCVEHDRDWDTVAANLLTELKKIQNEHGVVQLLVVSGSHDRAKLHFLEKNGLTPASTWYAGPIG